MGTKFPELFRALMAPFATGEVKSRPGQKGAKLVYVTARTVMNRLDEVLGPENWEDEYLFGEHSVLCRMTITLPDGSKVTKSDAGGKPGMSDEGDDEKGGLSDAFKRASVKFGIARYLYRDGVPSIEDRAEEIAAKYESVPQAPPKPGRAPKDPTRPIVTGLQLRKYILDEENAQRRPISDEVKQYIRSNKLPAKMADWTDQMVASSLDAILRIVKKLDAVSDESSSARTTIPIDEAKKPDPPAAPKPAAEPGQSPIDIKPDDPHADVKLKLVDATANLLYAQFGHAASGAEIMQMIDWMAWEVSHPKGDDIVIGNLREWAEPQKFRWFLGVILGRMEKERDEVIETHRVNFGA